MNMRSSFWKSRVTSTGNRLWVFRSAMLWEGIPFYRMQAIRSLNVAVDLIEWILSMRGFDCRYGKMISSFSCWFEKDISCCIVICLWDVFCRKNNPCVDRYDRTGGTKGQKAAGEGTWYHSGIGCFGQRMWKTKIISDDLIRNLLQNVIPMVCISNPTSISCRRHLFCVTIMNGFGKIWPDEMKLYVRTMWLISFFSNR